MSQISWYVDPWEIEISEAPLLGREGYSYSDETPDKTADEKPLSNDFGWGLVEGIANLFETIASGVGAALSGVGNFVGGAFEAVFTGVSNFIGGIANAIFGIFGGSGHSSSPPEPLPPVFNPIKTNLEAVLQPRFDKIDELQEESEAIADALNGKGEVRFQLLEDMADFNGNLEEDYRNLNYALWGEKGEVSEENAENWEEQGVINALQSEMWSEQGRINDINQSLWEKQQEIDALQDERTTLNEQMVEMNRKNIDDTAEFISRSIFVPRNQPVSDDYFDIVAHPSNGHRWRVKAKPGWTGHYIWQSTYYFAQGDASPVIDGREVGLTRQWDEHAWNRTPSILTYWVRQEKYEKDDRKVSSFVTSPSQWMDVPGLGHNVTETAEHDIFFKVTWTNADNGTTYRHRVLVNGEQIAIWQSSNLGPTFPWESGVRTRTISKFGVPLKSGDVISFQTYSSGNTTARRALSSAEQMVGWKVKPKQEA